MEEGSLLGGGSLLARLLSFLGLLFSGGGLLLNAVDFLNHEGTSDSVADLLVSKDATVGSSDGAVVDRKTAESGGSDTLDTMLVDTLSLLFDVLNSELAAGGLNSSEAVRPGSVGGASLVCDSSIQHISSSVCIK